MNKNEMVVALIFGLIPLMIVLAILLINHLKHKERMALIEKGIDLQLMRKETPFQDPLMWGLLSSGVGFGLFVGYILFSLPFFRDDMILGIMAMVFGGLGLIGYYFYTKKSQNKKSE